MCSRNKEPRCILCVCPGVCSFQRHFQRGGRGTTCHGGSSGPLKPAARRPVILPHGLGNGCCSQNEPWACHRGQLPPTGKEKSADLPVPFGVLRRAQAFKKESSNKNDRASLLREWGWGSWVKAGGILVFWRPGDAHVHQRAGPPVRPSLPQRLMEGLFVLLVCGARLNPVQKILLLIYPSQKDTSKPHFWQTSVTGITSWAKS